MPEMRTLKVDNVNYDLKDATARGDIITIKQNIQTIGADVATLKENATSTNTHLSTIDERLDTNETDIDELKTEIVKKLDKPLAAGKPNQILSLNENLQPVWGFSSETSVVVNSASGAIASFEDGGNSFPVKQLQVAINPVQEGTGDPSPDNVRPISGWINAKVSRRGANLIDLTPLLSLFSDVTQDGNTFKFNTNHSTQLNLLIDMPSNIGQVTISYDCMQDTGLNGDRAYIRIVYTDGTYTRSVTSDSNPSEWRHVSISSDPNKTIEKIRYTYYQTGGPSYLRNVMCVLGAVEKPFVPYNAKTYNIALPSEAGTVYGGTLDVATGKLEVNTILLSVNSTSLISKASGVYVRIILGDINYYKKRETDTCNILKSYSGSASSMPEGSFNIVNSEAYRRSQIIFCLPNCRSSTADETYDLNVQKVQELLDAGITPTFTFGISEPIEYQLTPLEIKTLLGANNIWADTGDTSVTYYADTKLYIDSKIQSLAKSIGG